MTYKPPEGDELDIHFEKAYPSKDNIAGNQAHFYFNEMQAGGDIDWTIIARNDTVNSVLISDLGIAVPPNSSVFLLNFFSFTTVCDSRDLKVLVNTGFLSINNGVSDITPKAKAIDFLTLLNHHVLDEEHCFTKAEMHAGQAVINWDNLTNAPIIGDGSWLEPALFVVAAESDLAVEFPDYVPVVDDRVLFFNSTIHFYTGSNWMPSVDIEAFSNVHIGSVNEQWIFDEANSVWRLLSKVSWTGHENGGVNKHTASSIRTGINLPNLNMGVTESIEEVIEAVDTKVGSLLINKANFRVFDFTQFYYDHDRNFWITPQRHYFVFGHAGAVLNMFLPYYAGVLPSNNAGIRMSKYAMITGIILQLEEPGSCDVLLYKNNDFSTYIGSLNCDSTTGVSISGLAIVLNEGDTFSVKISNADLVKDPIVSVGVAWIKDEDAPAPL